jgi:hypothetical protein
LAAPPTQRLRLKLDDLPLAVVVCTEHLTRHSAPSRTSGEPTSWHRWISAWTRRGHMERDVAQRCRREANMIFGLKAFERNIVFSILRYCLAELAIFILSDCRGAPAMRDCCSSVPIRA